MQLWRYYYNGVNGVIFVVDSNDQKEKRKRVAHEALHKLMSEDELRGVPLLVFANKQDLPYAMTTSEVCDMLDLKKIVGHNWFIQSTCAVTGEGVYEGLDWLGGRLR